MLFARKDRRIRRLLIVEDEALVAFDNEHFLRDLGYDVVATVDRAVDAIRFVRAGGVDLVLADVNLSGGGSGVDVAIAAAEMNTPVLFVSGFCPVEARALAVGCLAKPYSQRDLRAAIETVEATLAGRPVKRKPKGLSLYG